MKDGTTRTIQASELLDALQRITGSPSSEVCRLFASVFKHRNAVVHWMPIADSATLAGEQYLAWFHLQALLRREWGSEFLHAGAQIAQLDAAIKKHRPYLEVLRDRAKPELDRHRKGGCVFSCGLCGLDAVVVENPGLLVSEAACLVCESAEIMTRLPCDAWASFYTLPLECAACGEEHANNSVLEKADPTPPMSPKEISTYQDSRAYCGECLFFSQSVVPIYDGFQCLCCSASFENGLETCDYCNENWAGYDCGATYYAGCEHCDGRGFE